MNTMNERDELLVITMEECSEVAIEASKILRFNKGFNLLEQEAGDLMCMLQLLEEKGYIDWTRVSMCASAKREKLKQWSNLNV